MDVVCIIVGQLSSLPKTLVPPYSEHSSDSLLFTKTIINIFLYNYKKSGSELFVLLLMCTPQITLSKNKIKLQIKELRRKITGVHHFRCITRRLGTYFFFFRVEKEKEENIIRFLWFVPIPNCNVNFLTTHYLCSTYP